MAGAIYPSCFGLFCPGEAAPLREQVEHLFAIAPRSDPAPSGRVKAIIAPHAGYDYSGPVAASGFSSLKEQRYAVGRVILLGTCHAARVRGMVATDAEAIATPLGDVEIDRAGVELALDTGSVAVRNQAHRDDHALAVQLPFLQLTLGTFRVVPLLVGRCGAREVARLLQMLCNDEEDLTVVSSDLSHYHDYATAQEIDAATAAAILALDAEQLRPAQACGLPAIGGLLWEARRRNWKARQLDLRNSGDTAGQRDRVVGYGAFLFE